MSTRQFNFCAGPAALPTAVLELAQAEMLDWQGRGLSVMEISHRHPAYMAMVQEAESKLRQLMGIPDNYKVLFMQGGATAQFALLPMNLLGTKTHADYIDTGIWSAKAIAAMAPYGVAQRLHQVHLVATSRCLVKRSLSSIKTLLMCTIVRMKQLVVWRLIMCLIPVQCRL